eukprot:545082_1
MSINCSFGHGFVLGYHFKTWDDGGDGAYIRGPSKSSGVSNDCIPSWDITTGMDSFPRRIGLDITIDVIAGLNLYTSVSGRVIMEFTAPLYLSFAPDKCNSWGPCDETYKPAVLTFEVNYRVMYNIVFSTNIVEDMVTMLLWFIKKFFAADINMNRVSDIDTIDKSSAKSLTSGNLWTMAPQCYDIAGYSFIKPLISKYCRAHDDCSVNVYNEWAISSGCKTAGCSGFRIQILGCYLDIGKAMEGRGYDRWKKEWHYYSLDNTQERDAHFDCSGKGSLWNWDLDGRLYTNKQKCGTPYPKKYYLEYDSDRGEGFGIWDDWGNRGGWTQDRNAKVDIVTNNNDFDIRVDTNHQWNGKELLRLHGKFGALMLKMSVYHGAASSDFRDYFDKKHYGKVAKWGMCCSGPGVEFVYENDNDIADESHEFVLAVADTHSIVDFVGTPGHYHAKLLIFGFIVLCILFAGNVMYCFCLGKRNKKIHNYKEVNVVSESDV